MADTATAVSGEPATMIPTAEPVSRLPAPDTRPGLVLVLPWDFVTSFPDPMPDAVDRGAITEEDAEPERVKSFHEELARQLLKLRAEQEVIYDARRSRVDPKTGLKPKTREARKRLEEFLESEPGRLERSWQALIGVHEEIFGKEASQALGKAIHARHAGVAVATRPAAEVSTERASMPASTTPVPGENASGVNDKESFRLMVERKGRRGSSRLPVPRPLPQAIAAGHFGQDEQGPVNPSADEVRDITFNQGEELIDLLAEQQEAQRRELKEVDARLSAEIQTAVTKYAEDFGEHAAEQLLAYARRQLLIRDRAGIDAGPSR